MGKLLLDGSWSAELLMLGVSDVDQDRHTEEENNFVIGALAMIEEENDIAERERDGQHQDDWDQWLNAREIGLLDRSIELGEWVDGSSEDEPDDMELEHVEPDESVAEFEGPERKQHWW